MSFVDHLLNSSSVKFLSGFLWFPKVSAAVTRESVPCVRPDGSMGQKEICADESGNRIECPDDDDDNSDYVLSGSNNHFKIMAPPPFYADLQKNANDIFSKGYHFGVYKLDLKTKSEAGVEFNSSITSNQESGKVVGSLSSKYAVKDYGLTFTEKWTTDNTLATDITIQDKIAAGLKVTLEGTFAPQTGSKTGKLKTSFANDTVAVNTTVDLDLAGPIVDVGAVLSYQGWLAGVNSQFDTQKTKFSKNNIALDNGKEFGGSIYQKVSDKIECGVSMKWTTGTTDTLFGVGVKTALDQDTSLHAKINNKAIVGLGYQQKLRPGVVLTLSAAIDGQNFNAGGHKVGLALELAP
ncbi:unnamed protein product [Leptidea sinapis]|uniref:Uncharacterized protein n=1 Tax=Leptidea sinapis TaxID=189913 RepID=A0A5E4PPI6_9NEOP|nr:unnamed protein product [Leptidea sinapis]